MWNKLGDVINDAADIIGDNTKKVVEEGIYVVERVGDDIEDAVEATVDDVKNVVENPETFQSVLGLA